MREGDVAENTYNIALSPSLKAEAVQRPEYIGSTGERGLHHLVYEVVDNSVDEALAGYCTQINVVLADGGIEVIDNVPDPVDIHYWPTRVVHLFACGKFGDGGYSVAGGLHESEFQ